MARALIHFPATVKRGEIVSVRTLIAHPMETGFRPDGSGRLIPRDIINALSVTYDGREIFRAAFFPAIAANPFVAFTFIATQSGTLSFRWFDDQGQVTIETRTITVS
jgi:sulfur-oxidizing protein SoxZ